ncbi:hypothetical protein MASR2M18_03610 [Ignavibacteria bacterium]
MRKILPLLLIALLAVTISNAQTKKRIFLNLNITPQMSKGIAEQIPSYTPYVSASKPEYIAMPPSGNSPVYIPTAEPQRAVFRTELDQSDSATTIRGKSDPTNVWVLTGLYDFPYRATIGNVGQIVGLAQFLPPMQGNFVIDTIVMVLFKPTSGGVVTNPVLNDVLLYPVTVEQDINNFIGIAVPSFDDNLDNLISDPITIKADDINSRVENNQIKYLVLTPENLTIPAGKSSAFMLRPQSAADSMRWLGTFEWDVKNDNRIYGSYITRPADVTNDRKDSLIRALRIGFYGASPEFAAEFPSLINKGFRTNYSLVLGGTYDGDDDPQETYANASLGTTSVEEVGVALPFAIQGVTPNPITESGKLTFSLDHSANVKIMIVNSVGQIVSVITEGFMQAGTFSADIDAANLPSGMYNIILNAGGYRAIAPISVIR